MEPEALGAGNCFKLCIVVQTLGSFSFYLDSTFPPHSYLSTTTVFQGPTSFHLMQISTFANSTWAQNQGSGWLGDLQIHGWESDSGTIIFLKPWSKGNFSNEEMTELEDLFRAYLIGFTREVQDRVSEFQLECEYSPLIWRDSQWLFSLVSGYCSLWWWSLFPLFTQLHVHTCPE